MSYDVHSLEGYSTVLTAPAPASSGTSLVVQSGDGAKFGNPQNCVVWPAGAQPTTANSEIVRITGIATDTLTITRTQEGSSARSIVVGDQIGNTPTPKAFTDIEAAIPNGAWTSYTPTWTGATTNPVINNGTLAGYYSQIGKTVFCSIEVLAGSTTTYGSGAYSWALPVTALALSDSTATSVNMPVGDCAIFAGTSSPGTAFLGTTTTVQARVPVTASGANPVYTNYTALVTQGTPVTLATGTFITLNFFYRAA
jgi:hypothetical protein